MASWTVPILCVITLVVICGASDSSGQGNGYINGHPLNGAGARGAYYSGIGHHGQNPLISGLGHSGQNPLLSGSGIRGFHLTKSGYPGGYYGNSNQGLNYGDGDENYNKGSSYKDKGYSPKGHFGYNYAPHQRYSGYEGYGKLPEYYQNQAFPYYPDYFKNDYPAHHPLPHPNYPRPYGLNHYGDTTAAGTAEPSEEVDSVLKVIDEREIFVHQPQDKVLYIPRPLEEVEKEEKKEKEKREEQESSSQESDESQSEQEEKTTLGKKTEKKQEDIKEDDRDEYSEYLSGYQATAPIALDNTFCMGLADGNFANPGLTRDADPRCTYITCAGQRPIIFNCAPGTFNGRYIDYHTPVWASPYPDYRGAPHHRFEVYGQDFCGHRDIGTFSKGPVCSGRNFVTTTEKKSDPSPNSVLPKDTSVEQKIDKVVYKHPEGKNAVLPSIEINDIHKVDLEDITDNNDMDESNEINYANNMSSEEVEDEERGGGGSEETTDDDDKVAEDKSKDNVAEDKSMDKVAEYESMDIQDEGIPEPIPEPIQEAKEPTLSQDIKSSIHSEYSDYSRGYGEAPIVLQTDFCANMEDGNYANPGLTRDVDPRCTYVTCSSRRGYIFNCPLGTFNGVDYKHHYPTFDQDITSYTDVYHFRYRVSGFCSVNDYNQICTN